MDWKWRQLVAARSHRKFLAWSRNALRHRQFGLAAVVVCVEAVWPLVCGVEAKAVQQQTPASVAVVVAVEAAFPYLHSVVRAVVCVEAVGTLLDTVGVVGVAVAVLQRRLHL